MPLKKDKMNNLNDLAIQTLDKLLKLSDEELKKKFNSLNTSDLSNVLLKSDVFKKINKNSKGKK